MTAIKAGEPQWPKPNKDPMATKNAGAYKGPDEIKPSGRCLENDPLSFIGHILEDGLKLSKLDFVESQSESVAFCFLVFFFFFLVTFYGAEEREIESVAR